MKAICVTPSRTLELRDIPRPQDAAPGHVLVDMDSSTITHGDKFFLTRPFPGETAPAIGQHAVYGANGAGRIVAIGAGVPARYAGRSVAIYKSLNRGPQTIGLWCETAQVPFTSCLILPDHLHARDYSGSLGNLITAYAFLAEIAEAGHKGIIVTAGNSATGRALAELAQRAHVPAIIIVRSIEVADTLRAAGAARVIATAHADFASELAAQAAAISATAVFDGVGGALLGQVLPALPVDSTAYVYGFLGGAAPISVPTELLLARNLRLRRFANLETSTVRDPSRLAAAFHELEGLIDHPSFRTRIGRAFAFDDIAEALAYSSPSGGRPVLVA